MSSQPPSARAQAITKRTYNRPKDDAGTVLETWDETAERATLLHHNTLWADAGAEPDQAELDELHSLVQRRHALVAGRTLWLGGTDYAYSRAASQFNCAFTKAATVYDMVDIFWLLLNGCGVGFKPQAGTLHGFLAPIPTLSVIRSERDASYRGDPNNEEEKPTESNDFNWRIKVGDSAEAWAKALGKLLNPPRTLVNSLTIDFSDVRGPGQRLKGYGWVCNGSEPLAQAFIAVFEILNSKAGDLLDEIDVLDITNQLGTVLSSRRSAQIAVIDYNHPRWSEFAAAKDTWWRCNDCGREDTEQKLICPHCQGRTNAHRQQSNNSLVFWRRPSKSELKSLMEKIWQYGGSEPGFINGEAARRRAPWFEGLNPCAEILLPKDGFCNLVTLALPKFKRNFSALLRAVHVMARANYRQTCVDLRDGLLQPVWNQTNEALRLCGVSLTGIAQAPWITDYQIKQLRNAAISGAWSMADELCLPHPKLVTTIKPDGTSSKIMDVTEGIHKPLGRYIFNWVNFPTNDPLVEICREAGYRTMVNPSDANNTLICFPVDYTGCQFEIVDGREVNRDSAVTQLREYRRWNTLWADHNVSNTISWEIDEIDEIVDWLYRHWGDYVAVSWLRRNNPLLKPKDLGYAYLPQEVVLQEDFMEYKSHLKQPQWDRLHGIHDVEFDGCATGVCPAR